MKGLLIVSDAARADAVAGPEGLRPLLGRPFVLHGLEQMVQLGVREIDVVLDTPRPLDYEKALGRGERFGACLTFHLVRDPGRLGPRLRGLEGSRLVGVAHRVVNAGALMPSGPVVGPLVWCGPFAQGSGWSGWAVVPDGVLEHLEADTDLDSLGRHLIERGEAEGALAAVRPVLAADDVTLLLEAQALAFESNFLQRRGTLLPGGVTLGRGVDIDPSARVTGPVFIGDQVQIGAGAIVGPFAVVGAGAVIGRHTVLRRAVVGRRTLVGERLDIEDALATSRGLAHAGHKAEVAIKDPVILSSLQQSPLDLRLVLHRAAAGALFVGGLPLLAFGLATGSRRRVAGTPAAPGSTGPGTAEQPTPLDLVNRVLPGLLSVVAGRARLVGREDVPPSQAAEDLPAGWEERLASLPTGLISAALVDGDPSPVVRRLSDLTFAARTSLRADAALVLRYLRGVACAFAFGVACRVRRPAAWAMAAPARIRN